MSQEAGSGAETTGEVTRARAWSLRARDWEHRLLRLLAPTIFLAIRPVFRYGLAVLLVAAATLLRWAAVPWLGVAIPYVLALPAVVVVTLFLGIGPGLLAVVLVDVAIEAVILGSYPEAFVGARLVRLGVAILTGAFTCAVLHAIRLTQARTGREDEPVRGSEARMHALYAAMTDGVVQHEFIRDAAGRAIDYRLLDVNQAFERITGLTRREAVGAVASELYGTGSAPFLDTYARVSETGHPAEFEAAFDPMGKTFHISVFSPAQGRFATVFQDISERKQAEALLRTANERLEMTQGAAGVGTWDWDIAASRLEWSPRLYEMFGLDPATTPASFEAWKSALHPDDSASASEMIERALAENGHLDSEYRVVRPDGQVRWINAIGQGTYDANGRSVRMAGICMDITERKQAQEAIARSEREFRELAESMPHIVWSTRADGWNTYFNHEWMEYTGLTLEESYGHGWNKPFHPDDQQRAWDAWQDAVQHNARYSLQCRLRRADGVYFWWWIQGVPLLDEHGTIAKWYGTCIDIHEMKQAEDTLRQSREDLDRAQAVGQVGSWRLDTRRNVLTWSDENYRIFGLARGTPLSYETFLGAIHPDDRQYVDTRWQAGLRGEPYDIEHRIVAAGQTKWVREKAYLEFDAAGALLGGFGITQDVTERKRSEEQLRQLNESLERRVDERTAQVERQTEHLRALAAELSRAEQRERKRLANILHDHIQQLLVAAKLQLELVKRGDAATIPAAVQGVQSTIAEAIEASRSLAVDLSPPILHQAGLAAALGWLARLMQDKHGFTVRVRANQEDEPTPEAVRLLLFESVRELLLNAVKHSGVHEARVTLARSPGGWTRLEVEDQGAGFDARTLQACEGGGFGLFSIQQRLAYLGGRMDVESAPGHGTHVVLLAPAGQAAPDAQDVVAAEVTPHEQASPHMRRKGRSITVLLADDHAIMRQGLASLLQFEADIQVVGEAASGQEALELARMLHPDVVIMDINMPGMDGVEATRLLNRDLPAVKVLGLSMHIEPDVASAMQQAGAVGYLTKGGPSQELVDAIRAVGLPARSSVPPEDSVRE